MKRYTTEEKQNLIAMIESDDISSVALACELIIANEKEISLMGAVSVYNVMKSARLRLAGMWKVDADTNYERTY